MNIRELDLNLLLVFDAIYIERSISKAAAKLGMSQPAVSNALRRLRHFTGDTLFYKAGTGVAPTRTAMTLAVPIGHALDTVERGLSSVRSFDPATSTRTFRIGVNDVVHNTLVPALVGLTRREAPHIMLEFVLQDSDRAADSLKGGELDIALLPGFVIGNDLASQKVWEERFVIIMSRSHPFANRDRLTKEDLRELNFVATTHVKRLRGFLDEVFRQNGVERTVACAVADTQNLYPLVAVSDLVALVGIYFAEQYNTDGSLVMFDAPFPVPNIDAHIAWTSEADADEGHKWIRDHAIDILTTGFRMHDRTSPANVHKSG